MASVIDVTVLHDLIVTFDKQVRRLEDDLSKATDKINRGVEEKTRLQDENVRLKAYIIELEHRLGKSSRNSSKPPSSDGLAKAKPGHRKRSSGGQPGHKGHTLTRASAVDCIVEHRPETCPKCGGSLSPIKGKVCSVRQVQDLPARCPLEITDHRVWACCCDRCGAHTVGRFPEDVRGAVQYGPRMQELVVYLGVAQFLPLRRIGQVIAAMTGSHPAQGTIDAYIQSFVDCFKGVHRRLEALAKDAEVCGCDATGIASLTDAQSDDGGVVFFVAGYEPW